MRKKKYIIICILFVLLTIFLLAMDYYGVLSLCYIEIEKFHVDFWSIFINSAIVIFLYVITYVLIDKNRIKQEENKKNVAILLLRKIYSECLDNIKWMDSKDYRTAMANKINFDNSIGDEPVYQKLIESPFDNHEMILSFSKEGVIDAVTLEKYLNVKRKFSIFIIMSMTFYDKYELVIESKDELENVIKEALQELE